MRWYHTEGDKRQWRKFWLTSSFMRKRKEGEVRARLCVCACVLSRFSCVRLFATLWTVARQAPLSIGFSRQEYWSRLPCSPPGDLPHPGSSSCLLCLLHWQACSLPQVPATRIQMLLNMYFMSCSSLTDTPSPLITFMWFYFCKKGCGGCIHHLQSSSQPSSIWTWTWCQRRLPCIV